MEVLGGEAISYERGTPVGIRVYGVREIRVYGVRGIRVCGVRVARCGGLAQPSRPRPSHKVF